MALKEEFLVKVAGWIGIFIDVWRVLSTFVNWNVGNIG